MTPSSGTAPASAAKRLASKRKAARRRWGWDVEASDPARPWDGATLAVVKSDEGDVERFIGPDCLERVADHMQKARGTYLAHYGGGYDVPLLLNHWHPKKIVLSGSNILLAEDAWDLQLRDTYPWWLCGLAKMGDAVGLPKLDVDRAQMERLTLAEQVAYCERDVDVLLRGVDEASSFLERHGAKHAWTAGMSAAHLVRSIEPGSWRALKRNRVHVDEMMTMVNAHAIRGGRVECGARGIVEGVHVYDIKSSYPARYANRDVGIGMRKAEAHDTVGVWRCSWRWPYRRRIPPALDQLTMCGVGDCESWLIDDEIAAFERCGVKVTRHEGWAPVEVLPIGQEFSEVMFACKEGSGPEKAFSKVFFNAWHGKSTMSPLQPQFTAWSPKVGRYWAPAGEPLPFPAGPHGGWWHRYFTLDADKDGMLRPYQQPVMGALILGRARVAIWEIDDAVQRAGWSVLYNDTDSLMTTCPPDKMPVPLGNRLGELAHEGGPYTGMFLGPKAYCLCDPVTGQVKKCALKGVPHKSYADAVVEAGAYREARGGERLVGGGVWSRKGKGRDLRADLFRTALVGAEKSVGARAMKDGLTTFLRGARGVDDDGPGRWKRASVIRTVRPSGRGKIHLTPSTFEYLATVEVNGARILQSLPDVRARIEARVEKQKNTAALAFVWQKRLVEVSPDAYALPRLPRESTETASGRRVSRVDRWAAYRELLEQAGIDDHDGAYADGMWRAYKRGHGPEPARWKGGELDSLRAETGELWLSSPFEGFCRLTRKASTWRDVLPAVRALREFPGFERVHVPLQWLTPSRDIMALSDTGRAWLASLGPLWSPDDDVDDSDEDDESSVESEYSRL